jgi:hypothetical protein
LGATYGANIYRSRGQAWAGAALAILFGFIAVASAIYSPSAGGEVVWAVFGLCICAISIRLALAGVMVETAGIKVRNLFSQFSLRWEEIEKFDIGRSGVLGAVCRIHTSEGRTLRAFGIQESHVAAVGAKHPASELADALNEELAARQPRAARPPLHP